jgi:SAM-dependent methyltransferase
MPKARFENIVGHQSKYDHLVANVSADKVGALYVGGGDPILIGYQEMGIVHAYGKVAGASIVDLGCGIGRLTRNLVVQDIRSYLGLDIIEPILEEAITSSGFDKRFKFELVADCKIPLPDATTDVVVGFSLITHLIDEEIYEYMCETKRVLAPEGVAIFSFYDFLKSSHLRTFFQHAAVHRQGHGDLLKFNTKEVLTLFAKEAGFEEVSFLDGGTEMLNSRIPSPLLDVSSLPKTFQIEQSLCIMRI